MTGVGSCKLLGIVVAAVVVLRGSIAVDIVRETALCRQSLSVPAPLAEELSASTGEDVESPGTIHKELEEDEQIVFLKVAQAGQTVLKLYRQLHRLRLVNYTFLSTHHLFMSGESCLS